MIVRLSKFRSKVLSPVFTLISFILPLTAYSESYTLSVGESVNISQTAYGGGYIDNVGLAAVLDGHLGFSKNYDGSAKITVNAYFDYTATVQLVFIERTQAYYGGRYHTRAETYYKNVSIKCKYTAPKPKVKPTKVFLPERVRAPLNERVYIEPIYEPNGAEATDLRWYPYQGTAKFAYGQTAGGRYHVTGRSPGTGSLSIKVNDDNNLWAKTIIEVVDHNYLPPDNVFLPSSIEISVGGHATLQPILVPENAATSFTWSSDDSNIASVSYGKVTGVRNGTTTVKVKTANGFESECTVTVVSSNGKDDDEDNGSGGKGTVDGYEYVDLGLSVKWATCNVGASKPEDYGGYYAWGETSEKTKYSEDTYSYGTYMNPVNIGSDIKGTKYDVAHEKWGIKWRMPTEKEFSELYSNCTIKKVTKNSVEGYEFTGNNGQSIFLPAAGYKFINDLHDVGCYYWSSNVSSKDLGMAQCLDVSSNSYNKVTYNVSGLTRLTGCSIRPVTDESGEEKPEKTTGNFEINATNFPDENFRNYLYEQDYGKDGVITDDEIKGITIEIIEEDVSNLKGIENFVNLKVLWINSDKLNSLDLSKNVDLEQLWLRSKELKSNVLESIISTLPLNVYTKHHNFMVADENMLSSQLIANTRRRGWIPCYPHRLSEHEYIAYEYPGDHPTGINLTESSIEINVGESFVMGYTMIPSNAVREVFWRSDDTFIANIDNEGVVWGSNPGTTYIKVYAWTDWGVTSSCKVVVKEATLINNVKAVINSDVPIFNLNGQRMDKPHKGINIINGKKVIVK